MRERGQGGLRTHREIPPVIQPREGEGNENGMQIEGVVGNREGGNREEGPSTRPTTTTTSI